MARVAPTPANIRQQVLCDEMATVGFYYIRKPARTQMLDLHLAGERALKLVAQIV
jgi:hypothetical protein